MTLKKLINKLEQIDPNLEIMIDDGRYLDIQTVAYAEEGDKKEYSKCFGNYHKYSKKTQSVFDSWRGIYSELSIFPTTEPNKVTVKLLLEMAKFINGKYLCGYKGGDFLMNENCDIYIAEGGCSGDQELINLKVEDGKAILVTYNSNNYWN